MNKKINFAYFGAILLAVTALALFVREKINRPLVRPKSELVSKMTVSSSLETERVIEDNLWNLVAEWRLAQNLKPFYFDQSLCTFAIQRLSELDADLSHDDFFKLAEEMSSQTKFTSFAENLAQGTQLGKEEQVLAAWLESTSHLANLEADFTHACLRCREAYCVQLFARY
ncbi:MAG: hypothetical protein PVJ09_00530 [Candidatus Woesebacteria bacterium]|jgi:uncharacterized protein YkwD